jgi:hypothetical protein
MLLSRLRLLVCSRPRFIKLTHTQTRSFNKNSMGEYGHAVAVMRRCEEQFPAEAALTIGGIQHTAKLMSSSSSSTTSSSTTSSRQPVAWPLVVHQMRAPPSFAKRNLMVNVNVGNASDAEHSPSIETTPHLSPAENGAGGGGGYSGDGPLLTPLSTITPTYQQTHSRPSSSSSSASSSSSSGARPMLRASANQQNANAAAAAHRGGGVGNGNGNGGRAPAETPRHIRAEREVDEIDRRIAELDEENRLSRVNERERRRNSLISQIAEIDVSLLARPSTSESDGGYDNNNNGGAQPPQPAVRRRQQSFSRDSREGAAPGGGGGGGGGVVGGIPISTPRSRVAAVPRASRSRNANGNGGSNGEVRRVSPNGGGGGGGGGGGVGGIPISTPRARVVATPRASHSSLPSARSRTGDAASARNGNGNQSRNSNTNRNRSRTGTREGHRQGQAPLPAALPPPAEAARLRKQQRRQSKTNGGGGGGGGGIMTSNKTSGPVPISRPLPPVSSLHRVRGHIGARTDDRYAKVGGRHFALKYYMFFTHLFSYAFPPTRPVYKERLVPLTLTPTRTLTLTCTRTLTLTLTPTRTLTLTCTLTCTLTLTPTLAPTLALKLTLVLI